MRFVGPSLLFVGVLAGGCAGRTPPVAAPVAARSAGPVLVTGVWDGILRETVTDGASVGDSRVEKQEWHLDQEGPQISGYYLASLTYTSGDGRPYVCNRQATFSTMVRFEVRGRADGGSIDLDEVTQLASEGRCSPGPRPLLHYRALLQGDVLTLITDGQRQTLYRNHGEVTSPPAGQAVNASHAEGAVPPSWRDLPGSSASPIDVSGVWIWEHRGAIATGDEKQEREEWHVDQDGNRLSGYYDRVVREISTDGHAFKCSMDLEFEIATRYQFKGEVRGNQLVIYESSYEVLEPSACDNGQRRLDAYEGMASGDEVRLLWGVGGQVLKRPRPDVPTQRF